MKKIILIGSGGHAKSCVDVIEMEKKFKIVGFVDKNSKKLLGYKKIGSDDDLKKLPAMALFAAPSAVAGEDTAVDDALSRW